METVFVVLNYYELPHYYLNVFGGFSICFIITLYLQSYIFQFCSWHRVPIHYVLLSNIIALIDDYVFVGNMCKADYYGSSITDERHFALYIKDTIDDEDAGDGTTMRRWYATMVANGTMVDWEDVI